VISVRASEKFFARRDAERSQNHSSARLRGALAEQAKALSFSLHGWLGDFARGG
jgi:hypothetical protein